MRVGSRVQNSGLSIRAPDGFFSPPYRRAVGTSWVHMTCHFLEGVHILDLSDGRSRFCGEVAARLGATVRRADTASGSDEKSEAVFVFLAENATRTGSDGNPRNAASDAACARALRWADVLILGDGEDERRPLGWRLSCASLLNPSLITVSVSDFGHTGPYRDYVNCNLVASALGGHMCWPADGDTPPVSLFGEQAYCSASLFATIGMLLAIIARRKSRMGQKVEVSLHEAAVAVVECSVVNRPDRGASRPQTRVSDAFSFVSCADGYVLVSCDPVSTDVLSELMRQDLGEMDRRCVSQPLDSPFHEPWTEEYRASLGRWAGKFTVKELYELGQLMRLPWAPVFSAEEAANSPQHVERQFLAAHKPDALLSCGSATADGCSIRRLPFIVTGFSGGTFSSSCRDEGALSSEQDAPTLYRHAWHSSSKTDALDNTEAPLRGVRVLDLSRLVAGPYATRMLADHGAEVIKIQSRKAATGGEDNLSPGFAALNRNKLGVTLDMDYPEARAVFLRLVEMSDVVIENFTPRVMTNWGLGYDRLKHANENVIMVRMSAMGQTGPWRDYTGLAPTVHAFSGVAAMTSGESAPASIPFPYADVASALYGVVATLAALRWRDVTGTGCLIDLSEFESVCSLIPADRIRPPEATWDERWLTQAAPGGCFKCSESDKWCALAVFTDCQWNGLCRALGNPPWTEDEKYRTRAGRRDNRQTLNSLVRNWTAAREAPFVMESLQKQHVPCGIVRHPEDLLTDPQLLAEGFLIELNHPIIGPYVSFATPFRLPKASGLPRMMSSPVLGQHNRYVLHDLLGMSDDLIASYTERGVFK